MDGYDQTDSVSWEIYEVTADRSWPFSNEA